METNNAQSPGAWSYWAGAYGDELKIQAAIRDIPWSSAWMEYQEGDQNII